MRKLPVLAALAALGCGSLTACSSGQSATASACEGQTLNLGQGTAVALIYAPLYVAEKEGYIKDEHLKLKKTSFGGGSESVQALIGGSIDIVATPFSTIATADEKGAPLVAFGSFANTNTAAVGIKKKLAPPAGADLETKVRSLKGLKVAVTSPGSGSDQTIRYLAKQAGMNPDKDLTIVGTGGTPEVVAAFAKGTVDAFVIGAPDDETAARQGDGEVMIKLASGDDPSETNMLYGVVATTKSDLKAKAPLFQCYARALSKADNFIVTHPDQAAALLRSDYPQMSDADFKAAWADVVATTPKSAAMLAPEADKAGNFLNVVLGRKIDVSSAYTTQFNDHLD